MTSLFVVHISEKAKDDLKKLPRDIQQRIINKLAISQENPFHYFTRMEGRTDYKLRVGDYRVIADIRQNEHLIEVTKAGHRKNIYKNLD
jgi:mRNA interferase RelE/StbE